MEISTRINKIKAFIVLFLLGLLLIFALQNAEQVTISFLFWDMSMPRVLVLFLFFTGGLLLGLFLNSLKKLRAE